MTEQPTAPWPPPGVQWYYSDSAVAIACGDCLDVMRTMEANSVDAVVTDPPAGISFMGKDWDHNKGGRDSWIAWMQTIAVEAMRVIKPGGHALVWAIPRTSHWTGMAWENAGWVCRDKVYHAFGSGFPKSADISKHIDRGAGAAREVVGIGDARRASQSQPYGQGATQDGAIDDRAITAPATDAARQWSGWGTALKPAIEEWWLFRRPLDKCTVAENVLRWGCGGINVDGCRVESGGVTGSSRSAGKGSGKPASGVPFVGGIVSEAHPQGRFPSHLTHDGSDEVVGCFPVTTQASWRKPQPDRAYPDAIFPQAHKERERDERGHTDSGSAARFFQCCPPDPLADTDAKRLAYFSKAAKSDRDEGCGGMEERRGGSLNMRTDAHSQANDMDTGPRRNFHPTVKSVSLMRYLCRLISPPNGIVLDPFAGSGSTGKGAVREFFRFIGIERDRESVDIAVARCKDAGRERQEVLAL